MKKIIIAGGSGFLGQVLQQYYAKQDIHTIILSRKPQGAEIYWDGKTLGDWAKELEGAMALINLAGKSVNCRYTPQNKALILSSRMDSTKVLGQAIQQCEHPPKFWFNSSTATIYDHTLGDQPANTETEGVIGDDFSMNIAKSWEAEFAKHDTPKTKKIVLRTSIVYGKEGGAFPVVLTLAKRTLCSPQAGGNQWISWIHEVDFCRVIDHLMGIEAEGVYNLCVPNPIKNKDFYALLKEQVKPLLTVPQPKWMLQLGAVMMGTEVELILKSRKVYPANLLESGFEFTYDELEPALVDLV